MSINPLKEFFKRRKAEIKFARAGPGQTLSSGQPGSEASTSRDDSTARRAAAEAAMKRSNKDATKPAQRPRYATPSADRDTQPTLKQEGTTAKSDSSAQKQLPVIDGVVQRNVQVYSMEELARRVKEPDIDDEFFRLTVEDAKLIQQRYKDMRAQNEILRTQEMRRREVEAKRPTTNIARLRFKLPNEMVLEASFSGNELLRFIRDWLIETCHDRVGLELTSFDILFGLKPFRGDDFEKTVKQLGLIPATTLSVNLHQVVPQTPR